MTEAATTREPRIEYVLEGFYLQPNGERLWLEHSHAPTRDEVDHTHMGVDETGQVHQPSAWRVTTRDLNELYAVQGLYQRGSGRAWSDHTSRVDLDKARTVFRWFHRMCDARASGAPARARVVNMGTGEIVPMETAAPAARRRGDAIRTIPVTPEEWDATLTTLRMWGATPRRSPRADGSFAWKCGESLIGYEDADGAVRIAPAEYRVPKAA